MKSFLFKFSIHLSRLLAESNFVFSPWCIITVGIRKNDLFSRLERLVQPKTAQVLTIFTKSMCAFC